jgi:hypothetical protein
VPTVRDVEQAFVRKLGAERDDSGHHVYFYLSHQQNQYTVGKISHAWRGALNDTQIAMLARKMRLKKREFECFVDCSLDASATINLFLTRRGLY